MDNFVSFDGLGSTFLHNIYGSSKGRIRTDLIGEDLDFILELMKDRGSLSVLDLGCGTGFFSSRLAALGHHADLCDVSEEMIAEAEKFAAAQHTQQNMNFFCASAFELPRQITGKTYDLILCHAVMEWVEDQRKLLEIIKSRLSPGGKLSLLVYNRDALLYQSLIVGTAATFNQSTGRSSPRNIRWCRRNWSRPCRNSVSPSSAKQVSGSFMTTCGTKKSRLKNSMKFLNTKKPTPGIPGL